MRDERGEVGLRPLHPPLIWTGREWPEEEEELGPGSVGSLGWQSSGQTTASIRECILYQINPLEAGSRTCTMEAYGGKEGREITFAPESERASEPISGHTSG